MEGQLYTITYFSKSKLTGDIDKIEQEVNAILEIAQENNSQRSVTGALLYSGGYFIQVLEGPEEAVEEIFEFIQCDKRHKEITVLTNKHIEHRSFSKWAMALAGVQANLFPRLEGVLAVPQDLTQSETGIALVDVMIGLLQKYEEAVT